MASYSAPLRDMRFVYHELFDSSDISALPGFEEATPDLIDTVLEEAAKVCENELFPINRSGDEEGCRYHQGGEVTTPSGLRECYRAYAEAGWIGLSNDHNTVAKAFPLPSALCWKKWCVRQTFRLAPMSDLPAAPIVPSRHLEAIRLKHAICLN